VSKKKPKWKLEFLSEKELLDYYGKRCDERNHPVLTWPRIPL
jgi:hypothetical protein